MAATLRRVAELNNRGASMLVAARDKDAFRTLQTALTIMEQEMLVAPDKSESSESSRSSTTSQPCSNASTTSTVSAATANAAQETPPDDRNAARFFIDTKCSHEIPELKDDRYFIFNQALLVETRSGTDAESGSIPAVAAAPSAEAAKTAEDDAVQPHSQSLVCFYTSVVIYNLALAYHKRGMAAAARSSSSAATSSAGNVSAEAPTQSSPRHKDNAHLALGQSLRLYEHCLKIVRSIANYSEDCKMLLYAVSCNLAHLYCRKGDRSRAQELLDGLEEANRLSYQNLI